MMAKCTRCGVEYDAETGYSPDICSPFCYAGNKLPSAKQAEIDRLSDDLLQYERFVNGMVKHLDAARREDCKSVGEWLDAVANQYNVRMWQACELRERLTDLVDKLPTTADGVPVWAGMDVWLNDDPRGVRCCCVDELWLRPNRAHVYLTFHGVPDGPRQFGELWSTREAAEAAERPDP